MAAISQLESGHTPSRQQPSYWGGGIPWVSLHDTDALNNGAIYETSQTITNEGLANSSARLLPEGTVIFSRTATVGKVTTLGRSMATSQDFAAYICGPRLHNHFLVYLFRGMGRTWKSLMAGSIHNTIYMPVFKALKIVVPPLSEQRAIADALRDVDALLGGLDRLIAKKRHLKQVAMQQLLTGETRLPGFSGKWDSPSLGDLFSFKNGLNKAREFFGYGTPIVNYMDVYGKRGLRQEDIRGRVSLSREELRAFDVRKGDVFFTRTSETADEVGMASVMLDNPQSTVFSGFVLRARPKDGSLDNQFKKYCFSTYQVRRQITSQTTETTRALTNGRSLSIVRVARPPKDEQIAIAEVLSDMDAEIGVLEQRRDKTRSLKQAMMQELLTGRTRLV